MKIVRGDLLDLADAGAFDVIVHGCNCQHTMSAGIAAQIRKRYPQAYSADLATPRDSWKLGTLSRAFVARADDSSFTIVNAYTQVRPGREARLDAIVDCFRKLRRHVGTKLRIGYPRIGCGIGGLRWEDVAPWIDDELSDCDHTLVEHAR